MRIAVTGGAGFIGSHVVDVLLSLGNQVSVFDDLSTGKRGNVNPRAHFVEVDIRDMEATREAVASLNPEALYHYAAQVSAPRSVDSPQEDAAINIVGFINLLEAARSLSVPPRVVFASSGGAVYGNVAKLPCTEQTPPNPATPYGVGKLAGETYLKYYSQQFGIKYVVLRFANVFGPRQGGSKETGVCAVFVGQALAGKPLTVNGDGAQTRDYVYVKDVASASVASLTHGDGEILNIGSGREVSTQTIADTVLRLTGSKSVIQYLPPRPGDVQRACVSSDKAAKLLGWRPAWDLERGLAQTIEARG